MTDKPWEAAVASVSLAGRTEEIADMWRPWKAAVDEGGDLDWLYGQLQSLIESVAENWQGKDGAMFQQKANDIGKLIYAVQRNYQTMWTCLSTSRAALTDAKRDIPIPVFGNTYVNGTQTADRSDPSDPKLDYGMLYRDYQKTAGQTAYSDFKAKAAAYLAHFASDENTTVQLRGLGWDNGAALDTDYSINMSRATHPTKNSLPSQDDINRIANQAAEDWYNYNAPLASRAMETLRTEYAQQKARLPGPTQGFARANTSQPHGPGSVHPYDSSAVAGAANPGSAASFSPGSGVAGLQGSSARGWPSGTAGHDYAANGAAQQPATTGLTGAGHLSDPSPTGGLGGVGVGGVGAGSVGSPGGGFGDPTAGSAVPGGVAGWGGAGVGSGAEPLGPASDPQGFLKAAGNAFGQPASGGMGMMGGGSGMGGAVPRDEHHAWLTEDEDIWSIPPDQFPPDLT